MISQSRLSLMGYLESEVSKISAEVLVRQATGRELQSSLRDYSDAVNENARELGAERSRDGGKAHQQPSIFRLPQTVISDCDCAPTTKRSVISEGCAYGAL